LKKVIINTSNLKKGGAIQVANSFINECIKFKGFIFHIILSNEVSKSINENNFNENFSFYKFNLKPKLYQCFSGRVRELDDIERKIKPDFVISVFGPSYWIPKARHLMGYANPYYIYPESSLFKKIGIIENWKIKILKLLHIHNMRLSSNSTIFWVETDDVKIRLGKLLKISTKKIHVISNTYHPVFDLNNVSTFKFLSDDNKFKFITISADYPHKNFMILKKIIPILRLKEIKCSFYITLNSESYRKYNFSDFSDYIINLGPIKIEDCPLIYSKSDALFLPTLLECFSASYPEAMKSKIPILTSDLSFAKSICRKSALYFDPNNEIDIVEKIIRIISDKQLRIQLINEGLKQLHQFDNSKSRAKKLLNVFN